MKVEEKVTGMLLNDGIISLEELEVVKYGLENLRSNILVHCIVDK